MCEYEVRVIRNQSFLLNDRTFNTQAPHLLSQPSNVITSPKILKNLSTSQTSYVHCPHPLKRQVPDRMHQMTLKTKSGPFSDVPSLRDSPAVNVLKRRVEEDATEQEAASVQKRGKTGDTKPFRLLDLPAELRNLVYQKVAETQTVVVEALKLRDRSGLLKVPELCDEYLPMLILHAAQIMIFVWDFEFARTITFLNRLAETEMNLLPSVSNPGQRKVSIELTIQSQPWLNIQKLRRWLNRAGHATKKGTMLDVSYNLKWCTWDRDRKAWCQAIDGYVNSDSKTDRSTEEAKKIKQALLSKKF